MYDYIKGKVSYINTNCIVLENNNIGYKIFVPNPYSFKEKEEVTVFLYNHIREDENSLYGFKTKEERDIYLKLINVKGLGPKVALPIIATSSIDGLLDAINKENVIYLTRFPKIGDKLARQIILDLKGKIMVFDKTNETNDELVLVLENLGYKGAEIKRIMKDVDMSQSLENQIKEALKLLVK